MGTHVLADQWFPRSTTSGSRAKLVLWWSISGRVRCLLAAVDTVRMRAVQLSQDRPDKQPDGARQTALPA